MVNDEKKRVAGEGEPRVSEAGGSPTPPAQRRSQGAEGEAIAARYLGLMGWRIVARNSHFRGGELDLVAIEGAVLVFVEVRARRTRTGPSASQSVTWRKQRFVAKAAQRWLYAHPSYAGWRCRFDVITVDLSAGQVRVHHRAAFERPPDRACGG